MYEWLLVLHVLSAFALVAGFAGFWGLTLATRGGGSAAIGSLAAAFGAVTGLGTLGTLVFGIWLAIYVDGYELWDGWIIASLVLWVIGTGAGRQTGVVMTQAGLGGADAPRLRRRGLLLQVVASLSILAILVLMIFKPGA
jgi:uncharacterized membrane protein